MTHGRIWDTEPGREGGMSDVDERGNCSKCGGTHYGTGRICVFEQKDLGATPKWPTIQEAVADANAGLLAAMRATLVALEAERDTLQREREEDRQAIRALLGVIHVDPQIILIRERHAAAIARAERP